MDRNKLTKTYSNLFCRHANAKGMVVAIGPYLTNCLEMWDAPGRFYHTVENHLIPLVEKINKMDEGEKKDLFLFSALFHDVLMPEEAAASIWLEVSKQLGLPDELVKGVHYKIMDTKNANTTEFNQWDWSILSSSYSELIEYEHQVFKEYQRCDYREYLKARLAFLEGALKDPRYAHHNADHGEDKPLRELIKYVENRKPRIGLYVGSFNPFHVGHLDVLEKAEKMFDKVIVAIGINPDKKDATDDLAMRKLLLEKVLGWRQVEAFDCLLPDFIKSLGMTNPILIRGVRDGNDLAYEMNYLRTLEDIGGPVNVTYIPCDRKYAHVSSSMVRQLEKFDKKAANIFLPEIK